MISRIPVHGRYYITCLFFLERYAPTTTFFYYYFYYFVSYSLFLIFTVSDFCVSIKHGFLNVFPFSADMNCFYLNTFCSILTILYFYTITNFDGEYRHYYWNYFHCCCFYYYFCHCHCYYYFFIFEAFNLYCFSFQHSILYFCRYRIFLNFKHMTWWNLLKS